MTSSGPKAEKFPTGIKSIGRNSSQIGRNSSYKRNFGLVVAIMKQSEYDVG